MFYFVFIFGLLFGSFMNCLIWRLHKEESILGRSYCPLCRTQIHWYDNIPIISFLFLAGKCRHCHSRISLQYPVVELAVGLLFLASFYLRIPEFGPAIGVYELLAVLRDWIFIFAFVLVFVYDLRWMLIPDAVVLPAIVLVTILSIILGAPVLSIALALIIGGGFFLFQYIISRGKWIGAGDILLGLLLGAFFYSAQALILSIILAYCIGSIVGIIMIATKRIKFGSQVPLGVFLAISAIISMFFASEIITWYWQFIISLTAG